MVGSHAGIAWGVCKYKKTWENDARCSSILPFRKRNHIKALDESEDGTKDWKCAIKSLPWHCPPLSFKSGKNNYDGVDTFTIVQGEVYFLVNILMGVYYTGACFTHRVPLSTRSIHSHDQ